MRGEKVNGHNVVENYTRFGKEYVCGLCGERYRRKEKFRQTACPYAINEV